jgi:hypothetical protein
MPLTKIQSLGITDGTIVNADINASAAIAGTKLSGVGKILQVSSLITTSTSQTLATATYTDLTSMTLSITPSSTLNKILLVSNVQANLNGAGRGFGLAYVRNSTIIAYTGNVNQNYSLFNANTGALYAPISFVYIDSPSSTSSITYKIQASTYNGTTIAFNDGSSYNPTFYAMEIAG